MALGFPWFSHIFSFVWWKHHLTWLISAESLGVHGSMEPSHDFRKNIKLWWRWLYVTLMFVGYASTSKKTNIWFSGPYKTYKTIVFCWLVNFHSLHSKRYVSATFSRAAQRSSAGISRRVGPWQTSTRPGTWDQQSAKDGGKSGDSWIYQHSNGYVVY